MKYFKFFIRKIKQLLKNSLKSLLIIIFLILIIFSEGYTLEDFGLDGINLNPYDYCNLTDVDYTAILHDDPNGKANVEITEYLTFDVHAASQFNLFKELWRELPEDTVDGLRVTYDVISVSQILDDGSELPYSEAKKMYWYDSDYTTYSTNKWFHSAGINGDQSLLIYIPWTYREKLTFKIVYNMNNAALKYADCSELYLSMYSGNTITKLNSYKARILIPNNLMPSAYKAYTFGTANNRLPLVESSLFNPGYHTFALDLDKSDLKFNFHNRYLEFCLLAYGQDKHIFTQYAPDNYYTDENALEECFDENEYYETQNAKINVYKKAFLLFSCLMIAIIIYNSKRKIKTLKSKCNIYEPEINYDYFREIPSDLDPIFASELAFVKNPFDENKEKEEEYAAILLSLVRKQYVTISKNSNSKDWSNFNTIISLEPIGPRYLGDNTYGTTNTRTGAILEPLTTSERLYYELIERHSRNYNYSISINQLQSKIDSDYEYTNSFVKDMEKKPALECGVIQGYFQDTNYDIYQKEVQNIAKRSLKLGLILLFIVNGISYFTPMALSFGAYTILGIAYIWKFFYLTEKADELILFTQKGINEQAKWHGLYNFLNSDTLIREKEIPDLVLWEKYLIYATAFGISEKVIKALKIHAVELNLNTNNSSILNTHSYIHSRSFHTTSRSFGHSIHTSSRSSSFSGHGYGGGGRGGGGGGGGH